MSGVPAGPLYGPGGAYATSGMSVAIPTPWASERRYVSGGMLTVASGAGALLAVIPFAVSGTQPTWSGISISVFDAISGFSSVNSGALPLYNFNYGAQSGTIVYDSSSTAIDTLFKSGLVVSISGIGVGVGIAFGKI